jgi:hypothetical protein
VDVSFSEFKILGNYVLSSCGFHVSHAGKIAMAIIFLICFVIIFLALVWAACKTLSPVFSFLIIKPTKHILAKFKKENKIEEEIEAEEKFIMKDDPVRDFIFEINKTIKEAVDEYNKTTPGRHINEKGERVVSTLNWPPNSQERESNTYFLIAQTKWYRFKYIFDMIIQNSDIYNFMESKSKQYKFPLSDLSFLPTDKSITHDNTKAENAAISLINIALDTKL